jgi:hypothetical protein
MLASVILSVLIFSMAFTTNYALSRTPDTAFFNYADTIERETNFVLDYQVFSDVGSSADIEDFIRILEADYLDREIGANFMFIYGNATLLRIKNLGTEGIEIEGQDQILQGSTAEVQSNIRVGGISSLGVVQYNTQNTEAQVANLVPGEMIEIKFNEYVYKFPVSNVNQVIFIIQKDVGEETYVEIR